MAVIEFKNVSKSYYLGASRTSLREVITQIPNRLLRRQTQHTQRELFWALKDVSFELNQGEVLGIIGHNGAGKSTSLKLLSKVTFPTSGAIRTVGRMAALIELGAGFHPDLSGRENVYLNGAILGMKRREIDAQFDSVVAFSGLEQFIDTPVKRYSSGMYVRLAFATAAHVRADLLLVDEVLSVGDAAFQQKCLSKMRELRDNGATIVFVSHSIWNIETFCPRVILLRKGQIEADGVPHKVIELYRRQQRDLLLAKTLESDLTANPPSSVGRAGEVVITEAEILDENQKPSERFSSSDGMRLRIHYFAPNRIENPVFMIEIRRADGILCCTLADLPNQAAPIEGHGIVEAYIHSLQLRPDIYTLHVRIMDRQQPIIYAVMNLGTFHINGYIGDENGVGVFSPPTQWSHISTEPTIERQNLMN